MKKCYRFLALSLAVMLYIPNNIAVYAETFRAVDPETVSANTATMFTENIPAEENSTFATDDKVESNYRFWNRGKYQGNMLYGTLLTNEGHLVLVGNKDKYKSDGAFYRMNSTTPLNLSPVNNILDTIVTYDVAEDLTFTYVTPCMQYAFVDDSNYYIIDDLFEGERNLYTLPSPVKTMTNYGYVYCQDGNIYDLRKGTIVDTCNYIPVCLKGNTVRPAFQVTDSEINFGYYLLSDSTQFISTSTKISGDVTCVYTSGELYPNTYCRGSALVEMSDGSYNYYYTNLYQYGQTTLSYIDAETTSDFANLNITDVIYNIKDAEGVIVACDDGFTHTLEFDFTWSLTPVYKVGKSYTVQNNTIQWGDSYQIPIDHVCTYSTLGVTTLTENESKNFTCEVCSYTKNIAYEGYVAFADKYELTVTGDCGHDPMWEYTNTFSGQTLHTLKQLNYQRPEHDYTGQEEKVIGGLCGSNTRYGTECKICGYQKIRTDYNVPIAPEHNWVNVAGNAPTCEESCYIDYQCSICKSWDEYNYFPALGHDFVIVETDATCEHGGVSTVKCTRCNLIEDTYTQKLNHDYTDSITKEPTCLEQGEVTFTCELCSDSYTEPIDIIPCDFVETERVDNTCTTDGVVKYSCTMCGDTKEEVLKAQGHSYTSEIITAATKDSSGETKYTCTECGESYTQIVPPKSPFKVVSGGNTILIHNTDSGEYFFTGPNHLVIEGASQSIEEPNDDRYGTRQIRRPVANSETLSFDNMQYVVGDKRTADYATQGLDDIITIKDRTMLEWASTDLSCLALSLRDQGPHYAPDGITVAPPDDFIDAAIVEDFILMCTASGDAYCVNRSIHSCPGKEKIDNIYRTLCDPGIDNIVKVSAMGTEGAYLGANGVVYFTSTYWVHTQESNARKRTLLDEKGIEVPYDYQEPEYIIANSQYLDIFFTDISVGGNGIAYALDANGYLHKFEHGAYEGKVNSVVYTKVSSGVDHYLALDVDGNVWAWGENKFYQCGDDTQVDIAEPKQITTGLRYDDISAGNQISAAVGSDNYLYVWGHNNLNQLGLLEPAINAARVPTKHVKLEHVHHYDNQSYVSTGAVTCKQKGTVTRTCVDCGESETIETSVGEHVYSYDINKTFLDETLAEVPDLSISEVLELFEDDVFADGNSTIVTSSFYGLRYRVTGKYLAVKATNTYSSSPEKTLQFLICPRDTVVTCGDTVQSTEKSAYIYFNHDNVYELYKGDKVFDDFVIYIIPSDFELLSNIHVQDMELSWYKMSYSGNLSIRLPIKDDALQAVIDTEMPNLCTDGHDLIFSCIYCGESKTEHIDAGEHIPSNMLDYDNEEHYIQRLCVNCGEVLERIPKLCYVTSVTGGIGTDDGTLAEQEPIYEVLESGSTYTLPTTSINEGTATIKFEGTNVSVPFEIKLTGWLVNDTIMAPGDVITCTSATTTGYYVICPLFEYKFLEQKPAAISIKVAGGVRDLPTNGTYNLSYEGNFHCNNSNYNIVLTDDGFALQRYYDDVITTALAKDVTYVLTTTSNPNNYSDTYFSKSIFRTYSKSLNYVQNNSAYKQYTLHNTTIHYIDTDGTEETIIIDANADRQYLFTEYTSSYTSGGDYGYYKIESTNPDVNELKDLRDYYLHSYVWNYTVGSFSDIYLTKSKKGSLVYLKDTISNTTNNIFIQSLDDLPLYTVDSSGKYLLTDYITSTGTTYKNLNSNIAYRDLELTTQYLELDEVRPFNLINVSSADLKVGDVYDNNSLFVIYNTTLDANYKKMGNTYQDIRLDLNTEDASLKQLFSTYVESTKSIKLDEVTGNVIHYMNTYSNSTISCVVPKDAEILTASNRKYLPITDVVYKFTTGLVIREGCLVYDIKSDKIRVLSEGKFYDPEFIAEDVKLSYALTSDYTYNYAIIDGAITKVHYEDDAFYTSDGTKIPKTAFIFKNISVLDNTAYKRGFNLKADYWKHANVLVTDTSFKMLDITSDGVCIESVLDSAILDSVTVLYQKGLLNTKEYLPALLMCTIVSDNYEYLLNSEYVTVSMLPPKEDLKRLRLYVENYTIDSIETDDIGDLTVTLTPKVINLEDNVETLYEYQKATISSEALGKPDESKWVVKSNAESVQTVTFSNFHMTKSHAINRFNISKYRDKSANQVVEVYVDAVNVSGKETAPPNLMYEDVYGEITELNPSAAVKVEEVEFDKTKHPFADDPIVKVDHFYLSENESGDINPNDDTINHGTGSYVPTTVILTESGSLYATSSTANGNYYSYGTNIALSRLNYPFEYSVNLRKLLDNVPVKDFVINSGTRTLYALSVDGDIYSGIRHVSSGSQRSEISGFTKLTKGVKFDKLSVPALSNSDWTNSVGTIVAIDTEGNLWTVGNQERYDNLQYTRNNGTYSYSGLCDPRFSVYENFNQMSSGQFSQITYGIKFIECSDAYTYNNFYAIDENNDLYCLSNFYENPFGAYWNGVNYLYTSKMYEDDVLPTGSSLYRFDKLYKLKDYFPHIGDIKFKSIQPGLDYPAFIDTNNNLWELYSTATGYQITEQDVKDGAGYYVLKNDGTLYGRDYEQKEELTYTSKIVHKDLKFSEIGGAFNHSFLTTDGDWVFFEDPAFPSSKLVPIYGILLGNETLGTGSSLNGYTAYDDAYAGYYGSVYYNEYSICYGLLPKEDDVSGLIYNLSKAPSTYKTYKYTIDLDKLMEANKCDIRNYGRFLMHTLKDENIYEITEVTLYSYGMGSETYSDYNREENTVKSVTPVTVNNLDIDRVTSIYDNAVVYCESTYEEDGKFYSSDLLLDVINLEVLNAEYTGEPVVVGTAADPTEVNLTLGYEDGETFDITYDELTVAPLLLTTHTGDNDFALAFESADANLAIPAYYGVKELTATYPESVFVNEDFDPAKVQLTAVWSDDTITYPTFVPESNMDMKVSKVGDNNFEIAYEGTTCTMVVQGYYYDKIEATYKGEPVSVNSAYDKEEVEVILSYTENNVNANPRKLDVTEWSTNSLDVKKLDNEYIATFTEDTTFTDTYTVPGKDTITGLSAEYKGKPIVIGKEYDKDDVEVKVLYNVVDPVKLTTDDWVADSVSVNSIGTNKYIASYDGYTAEYTVKGITKREPIALEARYTGEPVPLFSQWEKKDVEVTLVYNDESREVLGVDEWTDFSINTVYEVGDNPGFAIYTYGVPWEELDEDDPFLIAQYFVPGYDDGKTGEIPEKPSEIPPTLTAVYDGPDVPIGEEYSKSKVTVTFKDSKGTVTLKDSDWTESSLKVTDKGDNTFYCYYKNGSGTYSTSYIVKGVENKPKLTSTYKGEDIPVGDDYNKDDVVVTYEDGDDIIIIPSKDWTVTTTKVDKEGPNIYTVTYKGSTSTFTVNGYIPKIPVSDNSIPIVKTGVSSNMLWIIILSIISIALIGILVYRKKED